MLVGLVPIIYFWIRKKVSLKYFVYGGVIWLLAISIKILMDLTITPGIQELLLSNYSKTVVLILSGLYIGLRTGVFECGFTYLAVLKTKLKEMNFYESLALGLGFGGIEAFLLGFSSFVSVLLFILFPNLITSIPATQQEVLLQQLSMSNLAILPPIIERISTLLLHVFATLLIIYSIKTKEIKYFLTSFAYKVCVDGMIPWLSYKIGTATLESIYIIEIPIIIFGIVGVFGITWMREKFIPRKKPKRKIDLQSIFLILVIICLSLIFISSLKAVTEKSLFERRLLTLQEMGGKYKFFRNDTLVGYSRFQIVNKTKYDNIPAYHVKENAELEIEGQKLRINGDLYITSYVKPLYYYSEIEMNNETTKYECKFYENKVHEKIITLNGIEEKDIELGNETFLLTNNMIGEWALVFMLLDLDLNKSYDLYVFNPSLEKSFIFPVKVESEKVIELNSKDYDCYVISGVFGTTENTMYVTKNGLLLKVENPELEIILES